MASGRRLRTNKGRGGARRGGLSAPVDLARRQFQSGDANAAIRTARGGLAQRPNDPDLTYILGASYLFSGQVLLAIEQLSKASRMRGVGNMARVHLASAYLAAHELEKAHEVLDAVLRDQPGYEMAVSQKADILIKENRLDEAVALLGPYEKGAETHPAIATSWAHLMLTTREPERAIEAVRSAANDPREGPAGRTRPTFLLAKLLEQAGRYDEAFEAYVQANSFKGMKHSAAEETRSIDAMINAWTEEVARTVPCATGVPGESEKPVFILGMPRSGTSLVEQVLSCAPEVHGSGELELIPRAVYSMMTPLGFGSVHLMTQPRLITPGALQEQADKAYNQLIGPAPDAERITDKAPLNYRHLGLIRAMYPKARVIHCVRNPVDTCLSCYFQNFGSALTFAYDLEDVGRYYKDYARLMAHWERVLDMPIHTVRYEDMTGDPEATMRALLEFVGVPWTDDCLTFHKSKRLTFTASNDQVRQPLYKTSVERWRRYEKHLGPLLSVLGEGA